MMLSIFLYTNCTSSLARCLFISLPIFNGVVCVRVLCIFEAESLLDVCWQKFFLPVCGLYFDFLNMAFHRVEILNFIKSMIFLALFLWVAFLCCVKTQSS